MARIDYATPVTLLDGTPTTLAEHEGKLLLIVNTASKCGFTPQYEGLEKLYKRFADQGVVVLGFPCDQFGHQEPGTEDEIADFCQINYGVSFPMFSKIDVNGSDAHPLFQQLKSGAPGVLGTEMIKWNFTKFLVGRDGTILKRYGSTTTPDAIADEIAGLV